MGWKVTDQYFREICILPENGKMYPKWDENGVL